MRTDSTNRILVLVPHEPTDDPRVGWVTQLCAPLGRTDVLGATFSTALRAREYDGTVYLERVNIPENASARAMAFANRLGNWSNSDVVAEYERRGGRLPRRGVGGSVDHQRAAFMRHVANNASLNVYSDALFRRGRALSVRPKLIVCHDVVALAAGVKLKRLFHSRLIYDSHEFWPEADLISQPWQHRSVARSEGRLIKEADVVVTVSPPLAKRLEELYGLEHVISSPNAAPFDPKVAPSPTEDRPEHVKFLIQGRMAPRRGYDELLSAWEQLEGDRAVLYVRCPWSEHLQYLRNRFAKLEQHGRLVFLPAVGVDDLVAAASFADVGLITYPAETRAHLEACPNKLSQFMHAGLAILANELPYVTSVTTKADCGLSFDLNNPRSLASAVSAITGNPSRLVAMKGNARRAGAEWFNWDHQSEEYRRAIERLFAGRHLN